MRLIAKAVLGALALASAAVVAVPADAARVTTVITTTERPMMVERDRDVCQRAPAFRPDFCFRHHSLRAEYWRRMARLDRERARESRQAFLERRWEMTH